MNQSSNGNYIHIDNIDFPNFSRNAANFPNSKGPGPIPKKGCESPGSTEPKYNVKIHIFFHFYTTTKAGMAVYIFFPP